MPGKRSRSSGGKPSGKRSDGGSSKAKGAPGSRINRINEYEDTIEEGGVDDFMFKRDQIMFNPQNESDDDDVNGDVGEEVMALPSASRRRPAKDDEDEDEDDWEDEEEIVAPKQRKQQAKPDLSTRGRYGKSEVDSDEDEEEDDEEGDEDEDDEDEEGWGRQYYSRPSTRREKEREGDYDEKREEERDLEEKEVQRLQKRSREGLSADDYGVVEADQAILDIETEAAAPPPPPPAPETTDPATLIRHMEAHDPIRLALARDLPLVVHRLKKTAKGIAKMSAEKEGHESLHKGLGWLHYQTLLTYATTLAFYVHLAALPADTRPNLSNHPITLRLLHLKQAVTALEDLNFAASSVSDKGPELFDRSGLLGLEDGDEDEIQSLMQAKRELLAMTNQASGLGLPDEDEDEEDGAEMDEEEDGDDLWQQAGLEDDELADLLADAEQNEDIAAYLKAQGVEVKKPKANKEKKEKTKKVKDGRKKKSKPVVNGDDNDDVPSSAAGSFTPLAEPSFVPKSKKAKSGINSYDHSDNDLLGDPTALTEADAVDKDQRKRSLRFHTSKIAATSARRAAARDRKMGGDDDVPRRDRQAARDAALRRNSAANDAGEGEDLDGSEWTEKDRKRAREVRGDDDLDMDEGGGEDGDGDAEGYYELVKRRKTDKQAAREDAHAARQADKFASFTEETSEGPRALTRAIEKNRGLTPRRSKAGRNPRVKKRQAYEKAKQKVGSQRAVFKGGQAALSGSYGGEKTGISRVVKSRKF